MHTDTISAPTASVGTAQLVCTAEAGGDVLGFVVLDTLVGGKAHGGVRFMPAVDEDEVRRMARAMTLKFGFTGLPQGGAKAGILGDPEAPAPERWRRLTAFGRAIAPLLQTRSFVPGVDMGTGYDDVRHLLAAVGVRPTRRELRPNDSGYYTAVSVFAGAEAALGHLGGALRGATVAIEGFGKVGAALAALLDAAGARVVAVSTSRGALYDPRGLDVGRLLALGAEAGSRVAERYAGAERLASAELLELPVDVLCPCAQHDTLHAGNAARVRARIVSPGANIPYAEGAERRLAERGVLALPYFVSNCGGVLGGTMAFAAVPRLQVHASVHGFVAAAVPPLLSEAARRGMLPSAVAEETALRRLARLRVEAQRGGARGRLFALGLEAYRRGWVPERLVATLSLPYFRRRLALADVGAE